MRTKMIRHDETQKIWFNKDIEDAIKRRKLYNRQRRNGYVFIKLNKIKV